MMHLCAFHTVMGEVSWVEFSAKYNWRRERICCREARSFSKEGFNLQDLVMCVDSGSVRVTVIGWWSERNIGFIDACVRRGTVGPFE